MKKLSFLSGLLAFALIFAPFASVANAEEETAGENVTEQEDVDSATNDVYEDEDSTVGDDVYEDEDSTVGDDVYEDEDSTVGDDVYEDEDSIIDDIYFEDEDSIIDDVYEGEESITDDVYVAISALQYEPVKNGTIELDYQDRVNVPTLKANLYAYDLGSDVKQVIVNKGNVKVTIPRALLGEGVELTVTQNQFKGALLAFDFALETDDGKQINDFKNSPITITFLVDKSKVKNWDDLVVYYINEKGEKAEAFDVKYNAETGEVWAEVTHFSTYGLFEEPGRSTASPVTTPNTNGSSENDGHRLPDTATDHFNLLAIGLVMALGGTLLFVKSRRAKATEV